MARRHVYGIDGGLAVFRHRRRRFITDSRRNSGELTRAASLEARGKITEAVEPDLDSSLRLH